MAVGILKVVVVVNVAVVSFESEEKQLLGVLLRHFLNQV